MLRIARFCFYGLMLVGLTMNSGCRYAKDYVTPTPDNPAPFSYKQAAVQLVEMQMNGTPRDRYIYRNGRLAEWHNVVMTNSRSEQTYGISYYERQEGVLQSLVQWHSPGMAYYEGGNVEPLKLQRTLTFQTPQSDTLREAEVSETNRVALVKYGLNTKGYMTSVDGLSVGSKMIFERNTQNNVAQAQYYYPHQTAPTIISYEYDDHPNPFFAMGRMGDLASDTSPNNVTKSTTNYTIDNKVWYSTTTYEYTYRPDGYPEKVVVKKDGNTIINRIVYKYNE